MGRPANTRDRFKRLTVIINCKPSASTASIPLVTVNNLDSGANIFSGPISGVDALFRSLGFHTVFSYSPPTSGA